MIFHVHVAMNVSVSGVESVYCFPDLPKNPSILSPPIYIQILRVPCAFFFPTICALFTTEGSTAENGGSHALWKWDLAFSQRLNVSSCLDSTNSWDSSALLGSRRGRRSVVLTQGAFSNSCGSTGIQLSVGTLATIDAAQPMTDVFLYLWSPRIQSQSTRYREVCILWGVMEELTVSSVLRSLSWSEHQRHKKRKDTVENPLMMGSFRSPDQYCEYVG